MQYVSTRAAGGYRMRTYSERPPEVRLVVQRGGVADFQHVDGVTDRT